MGLLQELEKRLERLVEGIFSSRFPSALQPLEVARSLDREMRRRLRVGVSALYAPNSFRVFLSPQDYESLTALGAPLRAELEGFLLEQAREQGYSLAGHPRVELLKDDALAVGNLRIESQATPEEIKAPKAATPGRSDHTQILPGPALPDVGAREAPGAVLSLPGDAGPTVHPIGRRAVLGRSHTCDVVVPTPEVSRRHAQLELRGDQYWLVDLDSTNGTFVNGERVEESRVRPGDVIRLGSVDIGFSLQRRGDGD